MAISGEFFLNTLKDILQLTVIVLNINDRYKKIYAYSACVMRFHYPAPFPLDR